MKVKIRKNKNSKNQSTLYLAPYVNGREGYYKIDLHVFTKPNSLAEREYNKEVLRKAEILRIKLEGELQEQETGILSPQSNRLTFYEFFEKIIEESKYKSISHVDTLKGVLKHLKKFRKGRDLKLSEFDDVMLLRFKEYLYTATALKSSDPLKTNSKSVYFDKVKSVLYEAKRRKLVSNNPAENIKGIKMEETERPHLNEMELKTLKSTPCENESLKKAFLFCCLTGLRHSDISKLRWGDIQYSTDQQVWKLLFRQKKTGSIQYHPIDYSAYQILGERGADDKLVFEGLVYSTWQNTILLNWVKSAGIDRHITFHCSRHTYATLLVSKDTNIYTIMNLMGHKNINTTQIYAKVTDTQKNIAATKLNGII